MKNGFNFQGANFTASGGSYRRTNEILEYGEQFGNVGIYLSDNLNISISNMTGYKQYYEYNFGDQNNWFNSVNESIIIEPYSSHNLSFDPIIINDATTNIQFNIIPTYHDYDMKSYNFSIK